MGVDFVGRSSWGADFFEEAKAISGLDIFDLCTNGPAEELDQVNNQLPCLVAASLASARALGERGLQPDCVAGFGIGYVKFRWTDGRPAAPAKLYIELRASLACKET